METQTQQELTQRETEVVALIAKGHSNRQIGKQLYISECTVKAHVHNILKKLDLSSRVAAAIWYLDPHHGQLELNLDAWVSPPGWPTWQ